jgi:Domain of unknown function (DUF4286)
MPDVTNLTPGGLANQPEIPEFRESGCSLLPLPRSVVLLYEVTLEVESDLQARVERYMREHHIPGIFGTGCFQRVRFCRASNGSFRTSYEAAGQADLDRYLGRHAPDFRAEFQSEFPTGVRLLRETWVEQQRWG